MSTRRWYRSKYLWLALITLGSLGGFGAWKFLTVKADKPVYLFGTVDRGDIIMQVAATGTLAAVTTVQVGSQVSGTISELHADFNSEVKQGQLLAKLDPELFRTQVEQADANVRAAEATINDDIASIATIQANLQKCKVDTLDKTRKFKRQKELFDAGLIPKDDLDTAQAAQDSAIATERAMDAQLESSKARLNADKERLNQTQASLRTAKVNLEHTIITSPISGTIISRNVDKGQTVAASFSAPVLYTIAADLTKMQVNTNIDEADVGRIKVGMSAIFSVDAYQGETFQGKISQIRLSATTIQNVVTYNAIIDVPNPQLKLKPSMTANVKILIERADAVLKIPNSSLRFKPTLSDAEMEAAFKKAGEEKFWSFYKNMALRSQGASPAGNASAGAMGLARGGSGGGMAGGANSTPRRDQSAVSRPTRGRRVPIWVLGEDKLPRPVVARLGLTDGVNTQLEESKLKEGDKIIIGLEVDPNRATTTSTTTRAPGFGGPPMGGGFRR
jgi:HlyD family secretion protein